MKVSALLLFLVCTAYSPLSFAKELNESMSLTSFPKAVPLDVAGVCEYSMAAVVLGSGQMTPFNVLIGERAPHSIVFRDIESMKGRGVNVSFEITKIGGSEPVNAIQLEGSARKEKGKPCPEVLIKLVY